MVDIPVVTELDADGDGKIGAQLATYAKLSRRAANGPLDAAGKAGREFVRMVQLVGQGTVSHLQAEPFQILLISPCLVYLYHLSNFIENLPSKDSLLSGKMHLVEEAGIS